MTPCQYASGETSIMSGITKRGDTYLRKQLIDGARTVVNHAHKKDDDLNRWITALVERRGKKSGFGDSTSLDSINVGTVTKK